MQYELYHHGILGMKWGIRRYQNKDGSLTEAGKKRYSGETNGRYVKPNAHYKAAENLKKDISSINDKIYSLESKTLTDKRSNEIQFYKNARQNLLNYRYGIQKGEKDIPYESTFELAAYDVANDKYLRKEIESRMTKDDRLMKSINDFKDISSKLDSAYQDYALKLEKKMGREWDGDGTELHWRLEEVYPEYRKLSQQQEKSLGSVIKNAKRFAAGNSNLHGLESYPENYYWQSSEYGWAQKGSVFAAAVGRISEEMANTPVFSQQFIDSYYLNKDGSLGKKIR